MPSKLCRWGNSLGVRLPQHIAECTGLVAGDYLYINLMDNGEIVIRPVKAHNIPAGYSVDEPAKRTNTALLTREQALARW